ncbi:MAG TPA: hypothetical protein VGY30_09950 [Solirubrobacteraceae bacterium]|nr:hypothetical protein [Solirubrobacteraceae bacterium]
MAALHQRDEILALRQPVIDAETFKRLLRREPLSGSLDALAVRCEVVVAALSRDRLALQVAGIAAGAVGGDAGSAHHALP